MAKRRNFSAAFKAKVALDALAGEATLAELSTRYKVHPNLITKWKRQAAEGMVDVFSGKPGRREASHEAEIKELHAKIGELTIEKDFLSKAFGR
jgi:transposase